MVGCANPMLTKSVQKELRKNERKKRMKKVRKKLSIGARVKRKPTFDATAGEVKVELEDSNSVFVDEATGRRFRYNEQTGESEWVDNDVDNMNDQQEESVSGEMKWNENKTMLTSVENNDVEIDIYEDESSELNPELKLESGETKSSSKKRTEKSAKQRTKRLSKVMKARRNSMQSVESKRPSFRRIAGDEDTDAYYQNVVTGDAVWEVPKDAVIEENDAQVNR